MGSSVSSEGCCCWAKWLLIGGAMRFGLLLAKVEMEGGVPEFASSSLLAREMVEGWEFWRHGYSPYEFGACKSPPLLMVLGRILTRKWISCLLASLGDVLTAAQLLSWREEDEGAAAIAYWVNPICALACVIGSFQSWASAATLLACSLTNQEKAVVAGLCFSAAAYAEPANLAPCLTLVACHRFHTARLLGGLLLGSTALAFGSFLVTGDVFQAATAPRLVEPSLGASWYLNMVLFDRFLPYFNTVFECHTFVYALPIGFRLCETPLLAAHFSLAVVNVFKTNPTFVDAALNLSLLIFHSTHHVESIRDQQRRDADNRTSAVVAFSLAAALPLATRRVARHLWLVTGTANANHVYFQDVLYTAASSVLLKFALDAAVTKRKQAAIAASQKTKGTPTTTSKSKVR